MKHFNIAGKRPHRRKLLLPILLWCGIFNAAHAQTASKYNLKQLFEKKQLEFFSDTAMLCSDGSREGVTCNGIVWLKGVDFKTGSIDIDVRGRNDFQRSFLGVAFHGIDTTTYDAIYFRPFNFQSTDSLRRKHQVQYISQPYYTWDRLRAEHPLVYESGVNPKPMAADWFHAHVVVTMTEIIVYVDHSSTPSLTVKKLNDRNSGHIGLWVGGIGGDAGDFANLVITSD